MKLETGTASKRVENQSNLELLAFRKRFLVLQEGGLEQRVGSGTLGRLFADAEETTDRPSNASAV